jgi:RNA polymerase primary sigma factor
LEPLPIHELNALDDLIPPDAQDEFTARDPMDIVSDRELVSYIDGVLRTLKPNAESVVRLRFGIGVEDSMTLEEIGTRFGVTRERIRQIEAAALRHLKHPSRLDRVARALNRNLPPERAETVTVSCESNEADSPLPTLPAAVAAKAPSRPEPRARATARPERPRGSWHHAVDKLLDQALTAGVAVHDDREGDSQKIWVYITSTKDSRSRALVRKLLARGFKFSPGKGYWR